MRRFTAAERRARLGIRHALSVPAPDPVVAARSVVALHSSDAASMYLSVLARCPDATVAAVEDALYEQRSLFRLLAMRRTMFVVPTELAAVAHHACAVAVGEKSRRTYLKYLNENGIGDDAWLTSVCDAAAAALERLGEVTATQLSAAEPLLRTQLSMGVGKTYERTQNLTPWVMILLAAQGLIVRGRPVGSWASSQWRWSALHRWLPGGLETISASTARAELARAWLRSYGPATADDLKWWTGWTVTHTRAALADIGAVPVLLDEGPGFVVADDVDPLVAPGPWVALLPALDPTPMGVRHRDWYLGPHRAEVFDRNGNVGPTVWCDGRVVGAWAQRRSGAVVHTLFQDVGIEAQQAIAAKAEHLEAWLGDVRLAVRARIRSPAEHALLADE